MAILLHHALAKIWLLRKINFGKKITKMVFCVSDDAWYWDMLISNLYLLAILLIILEYMRYIWHHQEPYFFIYCVTCVLAVYFCVLFFTFNLSQCSYCNWTSWVVLCGGPLMQCLVIEMVLAITLLMECKNTTYIHDLSVWPIISSGVKRV
jgi:hypothetical protein